MTFFNRTTGAILAVLLTALLVTGAMEEFKSRDGLKLAMRRGRQPQKGC